ncbi:MAG: hypothetical protein C0459_04185 [Chitinophaga sp.]|jgi:Outer membrane protein beta-barrel domain|nr:hypothetical protein [Chitinophaga sp.]
MRTENTNEEFEQWLQSETENQKMYPSEMVWENIRTEVHGNRSWPALTILSLLIIVSLTLFTFFNYPPETILSKVNPVQLDKNPNTTSAKTVTINSTTEEFTQQINPYRYTQETIQAVNANLVTQDLIADVTLPTLDKINLENNYQLINIAALSLKKQNAFSSSLINAETNNGYVNSVTDNTTNTSEAVVSTNKAEEKTALPEIKESIADENSNNSADDYIKTFGTPLKTKKAKINRFSWQLYTTPSISYRRLEDDFPAFYTGNSTNVDGAVKHKPALGFELGMGVSYNITKNFSIKTGLQFNIRQYYIDANKSWGLATFAFVQNNHLDSVSFLSTFSNVNTATTSVYGSTKLDNKLYQVSIPLGFEWNFLTIKKFGASIGASIQPTFTLNKSLYVISNDYKYYADGESFFRKWNYNTSSELLFSYQLNHVKLFFGPQIRYQHLPTYNDVYSIKEHRLDYGIKLGISKSF